MPLLQTITPAQLIEVLLLIAAALGLSFVCIKYRSGSGDYLCSDCRFNADGLCNKAGRPEVSRCTSYRSGPLVQKETIAPNI